MHKLVNLLTLYAFFLVSHAFAVDLGVQGSTWEIVEQDIRVRMSEDAAKVDWEKINAGVVDSAREYVNRPTRWDVAVAQVDEVKLVDITQVLTEDFIVPKPLPGGGVENQVLFPKGYRLNPLDLLPASSINQSYVIFSAESKEQLEWAKKLNNEHPSKFIYFTTDGVMDELSGVGMALYPVDKWFFITAQVNKTPSIVGVSSKNPKQLTVAAFAPPYSTKKASEVIK